jgi:hypothetical protein
MITTKITGGLGNQMFQYAIAKSMAKNNNDTFKLDILFYSKQAFRKYELNLFNIDENISTKSENNKYRGSENIWFKIKRKFKFKINRPQSYTFENNVTLFDKEVWNKKGDIYLDGFWQNENYFKDIRDEIINDFRLKKNISNEAKNHIVNIKKDNSISLHIRRGDYVQDNHINKVHGINDYCTIC